MYKRFQHSIPVISVLTLFFIDLLLPNLTGLFTDRSILRRKHFLKNLNDLAEKVPFSLIHDDYDFMQFSDVLKSMTKPPYVLVYDSSNVELVLNHICNLQYIPNSLARLVGVALDRNAHNFMKSRHPEFPSVTVDLEPIKKSLGTLENGGYLGYTLALVVHARICASLALRGIDFWSMHQDTIWVKNFELMNVEDRFPDAHMIFDTIGNELPSYKRLTHWICGSTFFVRASDITYQFWRQVDSLMLTSQSPDSSVMSYLCGHPNYKCSYLPHWIISSFDYFQGPRDNSPVLIQIDAPKKPGETKMDILRRNGLIFRNDNGTCDERAVQRLQWSVKNAFRENIVSHVAEENWLQKLHYGLKNLMNWDPYNKKYSDNFWQAFGKQAAKGRQLAAKHHIGKP